MSSRAVLLILLFALAALHAAADAEVSWETFVTGSDRSADPVILAVLESEDFETQAKICAALGRRGDPFAGNIIAWLQVVYSRTRIGSFEYLLRLLLGALFEPGLDPEILQKRISANSDFLNTLVEDMTEFRDPQLRGALVRLLPRLEGSRRLPALAAAGADILDRLRETCGSLSPADTAFVLDFLSVVDLMPSRDLLSTCVAISQFSREKTVVDRARNAVLLCLELH